MRINIYILQMTIMGALEEQQIITLCIKDVYVHMKTPAYYSSKIFGLSYCQNDFSKHNHSSPFHCN